MLVCRVERKRAISKASSCLSDVNLVAGTTFDNVYHVLAYIQVYLEVMVMHSPGVLIIGEALVWVQVLHRDRPHGNVPRSSSEAVMLFR